MRSTGREDTEDVANAGGNDSKPNVRTSLASLLDGIATVMTSSMGGGVSFCFAWPDWGKEKGAARPG